MASLPNIEIKFWSPLQVDYSTGGKAAPALNIVCLKKKKHHSFGSTASAESVAPGHNVKVCQLQMCVHLSVGSEDKDKESLIKIENPSLLLPPKNLPKG